MHNEVTLAVPTPATASYVEILMEAFRTQQKMQPDQVKDLLNRIKDHLLLYSNVLDIRVPYGRQLTVVGDTHGQYYDVLHLFELNGIPTDEKPYLFNGDFVDRGSFGCEIALLLFAMKLARPDAIHLLRGNHESETCTTEYGFKNECLDKYNEEIYALFLDAFDALPICAVINRSVFITHGGLPRRRGVTLAEIDRVQRTHEPGEEGGEMLMAQLLWSDPMIVDGVQDTMRPFGCSFGPDITKEFLDANHLSFMIRSHEMREEGFSEDHQAKLVTLFSAPNYCGQGNRAAYLIMRPRSVAPLPPGTKEWEGADAGKDKADKDGDAKDDGTATGARQDRKPRPKTGPEWDANFRTEFELEFHQFEAVRSPPARQYFTQPPCSIC